MSKLVFQGDASGTGTITIAAPNTSTNTTYTLPSADGSAGQPLTTNGSGTLSWGGANLMTQGRLTLTSATPVTTSDVTGATTVYFTPYKGNQVQIYDGSSWITYSFTELSQATTDATKSPAAVANNSNYDVFVWMDGSTMRATRGPAWTSDTARGTGAGTTELEILNGRYVNKVAITNGPAARAGLYVGTIRSDGSAQINDSAAKRHVWNNYNRVLRSCRVGESTDSWTYSTATFRQANGSSANQLDVLFGLSEDPINCIVLAAAINNNANFRAIMVGIGVDSTSTNSGSSHGVNTGTSGSFQTYVESQYIGYPGLGRHYLAWLERGDGNDTQTWYGDAGNPTVFGTSCIQGEVMA